jgi:hypothetical protein
VVAEVLASAKAMCDALVVQPDPRFPCPAESGVKTALTP